MLAGAFHLDGIKRCCAPKQTSARADQIAPLSRRSLARLLFDFAPAANGGGNGPHCSIETPLRRSVLGRVALCMV